MGISMPQLLIIVAIVVLLFGTKKLRTLGSDLGASVKGFKKAMAEDEKAQDAEFRSLDNNANGVNNAQAKTSEQNKEQA